MTYRELLKNLKDLSEEELNQDVAVYSVDSDEYTEVTQTKITEETDVLDEGHFLLIGV